MELPQEPNPFKRIQVNLMVSFSNIKAAQVNFQDHPKYTNLLGRPLGSWLSDFIMIKPSALYKANGGYSIFDARKLQFQPPYSRETLMRTLLAGEIQIESLEWASV